VTAELKGETRKTALGAVNVGIVPPFPLVTDKTPLKLELAA